MTRPEPSRLALTVVLAAAAVSGWLVLAHFVLPGRTPTWDEAAHALRGALVVHDLRELDWSGLLIDTYLQVYWPPLHSWILAGAFLVAGQSLEVARAVSVLAFVLLAPTLFLTSRIVAPRHGILAGSIAAGLALTSPGLITSAAESMLELPGLLAMSMTMLVYCALERGREGSPRAHMLLGLGTVVTYLVKSNYGILLVIGIVLTRLIDADFRVRRLATKQNLYAVLPLAIFCVVWFAYPRKVVWTWNMLVNLPWGGEVTRGFRGLVYFPRVIVDYAGSLWMAAALWGGLAHAWRVRRRPGISVLVVVPITLLLIGTFHHTKFPRHILPVFPPRFVLTGIAGAELWASLRTRGRSIRAAAIGGLVGLGLLQLDNCAAKLVSPEDPNDRGSGLCVGAHPREPACARARYAGDEADACGHRLASDGGGGAAASDGGGHGHGFVWDATVRVNDSRGTRARGRAGDSEARGRSVWEASAARSLHLGYRSVRSRAQFESALQETLEGRGPPRSIVAVVGMSDSTRYPPSFFEPGLARAGFREVSVREFPLAGARVYLYSRPHVSGGVTFDESRLRRS